MKKIFIFRFLLLAGFALAMQSQSANAQFFKKLAKHVKDAAQEGVDRAATNHAENDANNATDKAIDKVEHPNIHSDKDGNNNNDSQGSSANGGNGAGNNNAHATPTAPTLNTYKNYDFVPGDSIIFADDFSDDQVGELPAHWILCYGQGQVNDFDGKKIFMLTTGEGGDHAAVLEARMKKKSGYMPDAFTVEFDMYSPYTDGDIRDPWVGLNFYGDPDDPDAVIRGYNDWDLTPETLGFFSGNLYGGSHDLSKDLSDQNFVNKWHHIAIAYRNKQMKIYLDQNRIYVIPEVKTTPINKFAIRVSGKAVVTNVRLAAGGGMTMIGKKFTEAKIITHGITFDIDKSDIKPESMGTLNMIVKVLKNNPDLKFEIDGHTDNTGDAAHNLTLSQQRADAVMTQLVNMGIDASRLTTKGFGDTKPIADNSTPDGRANNRRVEFVRM